MDLKAYGLKGLCDPRRMRALMKKHFEIVDPIFFKYRRRVQEGVFICLKMAEKQKSCDELYANKSQPDSTAHVPQLT